MTEKPEHPASAPVPQAETTEEIADVISHLESNKKHVIIVILVGAIALSAFLVSREIATEKHLAAAEAYSQAASSRKVEDLDKVIADYPNSIAAGDAMLTKAELAITSGKSEDARITLLAFIEKHKDHPRHSQGLFAFGNLYQVAGENEKAASYYDRVLKEDPDSELAPFAMIRQGDLLLADGKAEEARQKYESIMSTYRGNKFINRIEEKLELLNVEELPVVPEPKKPEPKKTESGKDAAENKNPKPAKPAEEDKSTPAKKKADAGNDKKPATAPESNSPPAKNPSKNESAGKKEIPQDKPDQTPAPEEKKDEPKQ